MNDPILRSFLEQTALKLPQLNEASDILRLVASPLSIMPEGLIDMLKPEEISGLIEYLRSGEH